MPSIINALTASGGGVAITGDATGNLALQTAGNTAVTIDTSQNVGIGTTTPTSTSGGTTLAVKSSTHANMVGEVTTVDYSAIWEGRRTGRSTSSRFAQVNLAVDSSDNGSVRFYTAPVSNDITERMRIASDGTISTTIGSTLYGAYSARAWVNFDGTGTVAIRQSRNVSSITDNGTGDYTVNFTTSMPDNEYSVAGACVGSTSNAFSMICGAGGSVLNTGSVRFGVIAASTGTQQDYSHISLSIFR